MRGIKLFGLILAVALTACASPALAQTPPNDSAKHYVLVLASGGDQSTIASWFNEHAGLRALAGRVHYMAIDPADPQHAALYAERYEASVPRQDLPAVLFLRGDGGVIYKASRASMPASAEALYDGMRSAYTMARERLPTQVAETAGYGFDSYDRAPRRIRDTRLPAPPLGPGSANLNFLLLAAAAVVAFLAFTGKP